MRSNDHRLPARELRVLTGFQSRPSVYRAYRYAADLDLATNLSDETYQTFGMTLLRLSPT